MIRTVYDRRVGFGTNTGAVARHDETKPHEKLHAELAIALEIEKPTLGKLIERLEAKVGSNGSRT